MLMLGVFWLAGVSAVYYFYALDTDSFCQSRLGIESFAHNTSIPFDAVRRLPPLSAVTVKPHTQQSDALPQTRDQTNQTRLASSTQLLDFLHFGGARQLRELRSSFRPFACVCCSGGRMFTPAPQQLT